MPGIQTHRTESPDSRRGLQGLGRAGVKQLLGRPRRREASAECPGSPHPGSPIPIPIPGQALPRCPSAPPSQPRALPLGLGHRAGPGVPEPKMSGCPSRGASWPQQRGGRGRRSGAVRFSSGAALRPARHLRKKFARQKRRNPRLLGGAQARPLKPQGSPDW